MPAYWLGIMAVVLAIALAAWITLVLGADRKIPDKPRESPPPREIVGGIFQATRGGRQVMPDPNEPIVHDPAAADAEQPIPASAEAEHAMPASAEAEQPKPPGAEQVTDAKVPEQRKGGLPEQSQASRDQT